MAINKREKRLLIVTIGLLGGWLVYSLGAQDLIDQFTAVNSSLKTARKEYEEKCQAIIASQDLIEEYRVIGDIFIRRRGQYDRPESIFSEDIANICRQMGFFTPNIEPARREPIEGVNDYEFLTMNVTLKGQHEPIAKVMKAFTQRNFIIRNLTVRNKTYSDELNVIIEVAGLVQTKEAERRERTSASRTRRSLLGF
ncbi:MAG: hypothetical protein Kow0059_09590 [Candidatus Sumerlaeia bacterium]